MIRSRLAKLEALVAARRSDVDRDAIERWRADPAQLMRDSGFEPDRWQTEFLNSNDQLNLMLCARQVGKSRAVSILVLWTILTIPGSLVVIVAPIEPQAKELLRKVVEAFNRVKRPMGVKHESGETLELTNGSRVVAIPGKERSVHSYTASLLIMEEAARLPDQVFNAASPQLSASHGRLVALSTAFSKSGWFFKEWSEGDNYRRWSITANECPRHSPEFLRGEKRRMGERWYDMAYLNVFGDDAAAVFRLEDISAALSDDSIKPLF